MLPFANIFANELLTTTISNPAITWGNGYIGYLPLPKTGAMDK